METKLIVVMRNDKTKNEIKPVLITDSIANAYKIVDTYSTLARLTKRDVEYYFEYTPMVSF